MAMLYDPLTALAALGATARLAMDAQGQKTVTLTWSRASRRVDQRRGAAALAAVDPDGPAYIMQTHSTRRASLLASVDAATTVEAVQAITVSYAG